MSRFSHITFATKYSRGGCHYKTVLLNDEERDIVAKCINEKSSELNFKILALAILPDHTHILISLSSEKNIPNIVKNIKGYSARLITKKRKITLKENGRQGHVWGIGYNNRFVFSSEQIDNTIRYIKNQYKKHFKTWGYIREIIY